MSNYLFIFKIDNIFTTPDLSIDVPIDDVVIHLEAYKTKTNENTTNDAKRWVSIGNPKLVSMPSVDNNNNKATTQPCLFTDEYFSFYFEMLTSDLKLRLKEHVKEEKGIDVSPNCFLNLKANSVTCIIKLFDVKTSKRLVLKGITIFLFIYYYYLKYLLDLSLTKGYTQKKD